MARNIVVFLVVTGSMQRHIDGVRTSIMQIVQNLTSSQAGAQGVAAQEMKLAFVGYRDFGEHKQFEMLQFCSSPSLLEKFCQSLVAKTSVKRRDIPEDVFGGLENALKLDWTPNAGTKVLFHICDAPCHGEEFYVVRDPPIKDNYPKGDPQERTHTDLFRQIKEKRIQYYFGKITTYTDIMIKKFSEAYGEPIVDFDVEKIEAIKDSVIAAVNSSIQASITTSMRATGIVKKERSFTLDPAEPDWDRCMVFKGTITSYKLPDCIRDIMDDVPFDKCKPIEADIQIARMPFAHGAERLAYYGRDVTAYVDTYAKKEADRNIVKNKNDSIILKEDLHTGKGMNSAKRYEQSIQLQTIAAYLTRKFNEEVKKRTGRDMKVKFLKAQTLTLTEEPVRFMLKEKRFASTDKFVRFSNNTTYEIMEKKAEELGISSDFVQLVTAFSHWTHQVTDGYLMVVDLEGIVGKIQSDGQPAVILTDPAIHCEKDITRFGPMNHGKNGMNNFFEGHRCNDWCQRMTLSVPNSED